MRLMKISGIQKQKKKIINNFLIKIRSKQFGIADKNTFYTEDGKLSDKYYKHERLPEKLAEALNENFQNLQKSIKEEGGKEDEYLEIKKQIFPTENKEKEFLANKNIKFQIPRTIYKGFLNKGMLGEAIKLTHKNMELYVIGTMYDRINSINLYKLLNIVKPDVILLQLRPDRILSNINKYYDAEDNEILEKLIREPSEIQPSLEVRDQVKRRLMDKGFLISSQKGATNEELSKYKSLSTDKSERLTNEAISVISLWGEQKNSKIVLSDLPEGLLIERVANSLSLLQIRQIFEDIFTQFPNNPDWEPRTSLGAAINLYPDLFVQPSDSVIAHTINTLSIANSGTAIKAVIFSGYGQTKSLPLHLNYDLDRNSLQKALTVPLRYKSFLQGEDSLEILAEKWCLLSIIINGVDLKNHEKQTTIQIISNLIHKYSRDDMIKTGFNSENHLVNRTKHLYNELVEAKTDQALEYIGKGYEIKKKLFMRKIFNDPLFNSQLL